MMQNSSISLYIDVMFGKYLSDKPEDIFDDVDVKIFSLPLIPDDTSPLDDMMPWNEKEGVNMSYDEDLLLRNFLERDGY